MCVLNYELVLIIHFTSDDEISDLPDDVDDQGVDDVRLEAHVAVAELKVVVHDLPSEKVWSYTIYNFNLGQNKISMTTLV